MEQLPPIIWYSQTPEVITHCLSSPAVTLPSRPVSGAKFWDDSRNERNGGKSGGWKRGGLWIYHEGTISGKYGFCPPHSAHLGLLILHPSTTTVTTSIFGPFPFYPSVPSPQTLDFEACLPGFPPKKTAREPNFLGSSL